jgi:hypothetical protein
VPRISSLTLSRFAMSRSSCLTGCLLDAATDLRLHRLYAFLPLSLHGVQGGVGKGATFRKRHLSDFLQGQFFCLLTHFGPPFCLFGSCLACGCTVDNPLV